MRHFKKLIFMGNGERSEAKCQELHKRLEDGFSISSGEQQGADIPAKSLLDRKHVVMDVAAALTGYNIEFTTKLPYP